MQHVTWVIILDYNQRRWVEFNDYLSVRTPNGDMIPPKWQGWLSQQYDDVPAPDSDGFHDPYFEKPHQWHPSESGFKIYTSRHSIVHPDAVKFRDYRLGRYAAEWQPVTKRS